MLWSASRGTIWLGGRLANSGALQVATMRSRPGLCDRLRREMMKACLNVAETHGLTVEGGELSDIDLRHGFDISLRVGIPMADGATYSPDEALFEELCRPGHEIAGTFERRPLPVRFISQKSVDSFPMNVSRPLGLTKIRDSQLHQGVAYRCGVEDIRVEQDRVLAHFEP